MKRAAILLLAASATLSVWAQNPQATPKVVGKLTDVQGLVTVSTGDQLTSAVNGGPLSVGNRIVTTGSGGATLVFNDGCKITMKVNQSLVIKEGADCAALLASVGPVGAPVATPVVAAVGGGLDLGLLGAGAALGGVILLNHNGKLSTN